MSDAIPILFKTFEAPSGVLCVYESGKQVPFIIQRVFTVAAKSGHARGDHAHRQCTQLLVCVSGRIRVSCDNGSTIKDYLAILATYKTTRNNKMVEILIQTDQVYTEIERTISIRLNHINTIIELFVMMEN